MDSRIKFRHLQTFIEVARQKSVGKAADVLSITQPAVTRTIRELEDYLGAALFEREGRGIRISPFRRGFSETCRRKHRRRAARRGFDRPGQALDGAAAQDRRSADGLGEPYAGGGCGIPESRHRQPRDDRDRREPLAARCA